MIVGIDVSKDKLDIKMLPNNQHDQIQNSKNHIRSFIKNKLIKSGKPDIIVFESTGGYEKQLMSSLIDFDIPFHRAHPNRVYHFAKGKGYFAKTDRIDAEVLARYGQQEEIVADKPREIEALKNQELSSRKSQLKGMIEQETHRLRSMYFNKQIARSIQRSIKQLKEELKIIDRQLEESLARNEENLAKLKLLQTIPGVGREVSMTLVTDMPELGTLSRGQISALVGVAPQNKDSGRKQGSRHIGKGRQQVRKVLYMSALVGMRYNPVLKVFYEKLRANGKKPKVALVALMRKLIITMNAMVRENRPWRMQQHLT